MQVATKKSGTISLTLYAVTGKVKVSKIMKPAGTVRLGDTVFGLIA